MSMSTVVGMPQSVPQPANIAPRLVRHEFLGAFTSSVAGHEGFIPANTKVLATSSAPSKISRFCEVDEPFACLTA